MGRVRNLRVPARRFGALTREAPLDDRKVPIGDHFGRKTNVWGSSKTTVSCLSTLGIVPLPRCASLAGRYIWNSFYGDHRGIFFILRTSRSNFCIPALLGPVRSPAAAESTRPAGLFHSYCF